MNDELDNLVNALPAYKHLQFRFAADRSHDKKLLDWFADGGEIRSWRKDTSLYSTYVSKGGLKMRIGVIGETIEVHEKNKWVFNYLAYFRSKNKTLKYCTSNSQRTVSEIQNDPSVLKFNESTVWAKDGSCTPGNIFYLSKDTVNTITKSESKVNVLLDSLIDNYSNIEI